MRLSAIPGSKILKKGVQIGPKFKRWFGTQEDHSALLKCRSAEKCRLAQIVGSPEGSWIKINPTIFDFLEIRTRPSLYLIIQLIFWSIPTSIN